MVPIRGRCANRSRRYLVAMLLEFLHYLKVRKKFWLLPVMVMMVIFGSLLMLQGSILAPFLYTIF
jgi:hypothetical protein